MESNRQLKSTWLAKQFLDVFKAKPHWPAADIIDTVRRAYKVLIKKGFAYKVKYYAHRLLHGSMKEHYSRLGSYIAALEETNPTGSYTLLTNPNVTSNPPTFQRFYVCFDALKQGWLLGCRRILSVDACFLKTFLGGQLIAAVGRDGNEQMFPVAWAVVEGENNDSYEWFFKQLKLSLGIEDGEGMTIISDQHNSIVAMVAQEFPRAEHRHCARHIFANWHKTYKGEDMKIMFWACAKAYNEADFKEALLNLKAADPKAAEAFIACNPTLFCRAFIQRHTQNDVIVSNMSETFNAYIIDARSKHVIYMLEEIRTSIMQRLVEKKTEMEMPLNPPPVKIGPGRPRKKRRRDPHEDPIKKGKLTKHGLVMSCYVCKSLTHNKRRCPDKDKAQEPAAPKRPMGRPRKYPRVESTAESVVHNSQTHHGVTAKPTRVGRNGRVILSGRGGAIADARGGGRSGRRGGGRGGGRSRPPQGFGVLIDEQGNAFRNDVGSTRGPTSIVINGADGPITQETVNQTV